MAQHCYHKCWLNLPRVERREVDRNHCNPGEDDFMSTYLFIHGQVFIVLVTCHTEIYQNDESTKKYVYQINFVT